MKFSIRKIPLERRLQTGAVFLLVFFALCCLFLWVTCIINPILWFFYVPYLIYASLYKPQQRGGYTLPFMKNLAFWRYFSNYYPASIKFQFGYFFNFLHIFFNRKKSEIIGTILLRKKMRNIYLRFIHMGSHHWVCGQIYCPTVLDFMIN